MQTASGNHRPALNAAVQCGGNPGGAPWVHGVHPTRTLATALVGWALPTRLTAGIAGSTVQRHMPSTADDPVSCTAFVTLLEQRAPRPLSIQEMARLLELERYDRKEIRG